MNWNPEHYLTYEDLRLRPALDLMGRISVQSPRTVVDLGCGPGNVTRLLQERWGGADIVGIDSSTEMLDRAKTVDTIAWRRDDIATWRADAPVDVLFSNAAYHWLDDHCALFPRLLAQVAPGGVFACQMPANYHRPAHAAIHDAARSGPWSDRLVPLIRAHPVLGADVYYDLLAPLTTRLDIWYCDYLQVMDGEDPVLDFVASTVLRPYLEALEGGEREVFFEDVRQRLRLVHPKQPDGKTLFPFRRLFIVATRP